MAPRRDVDRPAGLPAADQPAVGHPGTPPSADVRRAGVPSTRGAPRALWWGLIAAFAVHDLEELVTGPASSARLAGAVRARWPGAPPALEAALTLSRRRTGTAVALVGGVVAVAAVRGARTAGRDGLYQAVLVAFGLHAATHVLASAVARGYTPGAVTAPVVVAPFALWSLAELRRCGALAPGDLRRAARTTRLFPLALLATHALAWAVTRRPSR